MNKYFKPAYGEQMNHNIDLEKIKAERFGKKTITDAVVLQPR